MERKIHTHLYVNISLFLAVEYRLKDFEDEDYKSINLDKKRWRDDANYIKEEIAKNFLLLTILPVQYRKDKSFVCTALNAMQTEMMKLHARVKDVGFLYNKILYQYPELKGSKDEYVLEQRMESSVNLCHSSSDVR